MPLKLGQYTILNVGLILHLDYRCYFLEEFKKGNNCASEIREKHHKFRLIIQRPLALPHSKACFALFVKSVLVFSLKIQWNGRTGH